MPHLSLGATWQPLCKNAGSEDLMDYLIVLWSLLLSIFAGVPTFYYLYMRQCSGRPWNVKKNIEYSPIVTILVPMHNEENTIGLKLENLAKLNYPKEKLQTIVVDDSSDDSSVLVVKAFQKSNKTIETELLENKGPRGKTASLNLALKHAVGEIVVVSDADCFCPSDVLLKSLPFLADPSVGAVTGLEILLNPQETWVTETELMYNNVVHSIRIGESKFYSTIIFQGGFGAYRRAILGQFDDETDDSGTALSIVQKRARTLLLPEAVYFTISPKKFTGKVRTKLRRAGHLERLWLRCLKLFSEGRLVLPKRILFPEAFMHLVGPFVFLLLIPTTLLVLLENYFFSIFLFVLLIGCTLSRGFRTLTVETIQNQFLLIGAMSSRLLRHNFQLWTGEESSRESLTREVLESRDLLQSNI